MQNHERTEDGITNASNRQHAIPLSLFTRGATKASLIEIQHRFPEVDEFTLLRFLKSRNGDVEKTILKIEAHIKWRAECFKELPAEHVAATKFCFCTDKHDRQGNTLMVYRGDRHDGQHDDADIVSVVIQELRRASSLSLSTERKVTLLVFAPKGTPFKRSSVKHIVRTCSDNYPEHLAKVFVFPTNAFSRGIWSFISWFMDPVTVKKVHLLDGGRSPPVLKEHIEEESIPVDFGGRLLDDS
eukprot:m.52720 g.52720  ORF g.52720 m.52720 type:complete len:242 (-) comp15426_c0_seq11:266-991(-)